MNQIFPEAPPLVGEYYVHRTPGWLVALIRLAFCIGAIAVATMSYQDWSKMPLGFRGLTCVLVPAFAFFAFHGRTWKKTVKFIAADAGIFFPCSELIVTVVGQEHKNAWLLVPWANITNVRITKEYDNANDLATCVAFDLRVSQEEQAGFFQRVGYPTDSARHDESLLSVAYSDNPPSPKKTLARLKDLRQRHSISFQEARRDEAASHP